MLHSLIEIPTSEWPKLRDLYTPHKRSSSAYNLLQNFINWAAQDPEGHVKIYSLDGDWEEDGTFVAHDNFNNPIALFQMHYCNTLSDDHGRLLRALNCLDSKVTNLICGFPERLLPTVQRYFSDAGHAKENFRADGTCWYHIDRAEAAKFSTEAPEGITLAPLDLQHAEHVNKIWPHNAPGSVEFVKRLIRYNNSVGAFDEQGNLVAWCLRLPLGSLGLLQVEATHKRRGLGGLVVRYLSKLIAAQGLEVTAPVVFTNEASRSMFDKLGFKVIDKVYWALVPAKEA